MCRSPLPSAARRNEAQPHFAPRRRTRRSRAFSLLEVLLSLAILGVAMTIIGQLVGTAGRAAARAELQSEALLRCETKLAERVAAIRGEQSPPRDLEESPFDDDPRWRWSMQCAPTETDRLWRLQVMVWRMSDSAQGQTDFQLSRYVYQGTAPRGATGRAGAVPQGASPPHSSTPPASRL